jgi:Family of unknown function (DUF6220)
MADHPVLVAAQRGLASLAMALVVTQFFLAGAGAFGATSFDAHKTVGSILVIVVLLGLLVAALVRRHVAHAAIFFGVTLLQLVLGAIGSDEPWVGALHGLNAIAALGAGGTLAQKAWGRGAAPAARPA